MFENPPISTNYSETRVFGEHLPEDMREMRLLGSFNYGSDCWNGEMFQSLCNPALYVLEYVEWYDYEPGRKDESVIRYYFSPDVKEEKDYPTFRDLVEDIERGQLLFEIPYYESAHLTKGG